MLAHISKFNHLSQVVLRQLSNISDKFRDVLTYRLYDKILMFDKIDLEEFLGTSDEYLSEYESIFAIAKSEIIEHMIGKVSNIEYIDKRGKRLIHYISRYRNYRILKSFINIKPELNCQDMNGNTPLHYICSHNPNRCIGMLKLMYDNNVDFNIQNNYGWYPLHEVCLNGSFEELVYVFKLSAFKNKKITRCYNGIKCEFLPYQFVQFNNNLYDIEKKEVINKFMQDLKSTISGYNTTPYQLVQFNNNLNDIEKQAVINKFMLDFYPTISSFNT